MVGVALLVFWHARTYAYCCRRCGNEFAISAALNFVCPHGLWFEGGWKLLRCPRCHRWTRARVIRKSAMSKDGPASGGDRLLALTAHWRLVRLGGLAKTWET